MSRWRVVCSAAIRAAFRFSLVRDACLFGLLAGEDLGLLGLGFTLGALPGELGALRCAPHLDVAFLLEPRRLALTIDGERFLLRFEVAGPDPHHGILHRCRCGVLRPGLDLLDESREAFRVEAVGGVEVLEVGLVELGDRDRLELETVHFERFGGGRPHLGDVVAATLVHFHERHLGADRAQRADELAREQLVEASLLHGAAPQRRGRDRYCLASGRHAHVELRHHVHAHPVPW